MQFVGIDVGSKELVAVAVVTCAEPVEARAKRTRPRPSRMTQKATWR